jgi:hypothetical protein
MTFAIHLHVMERIYNNLKQFHACKMFSYYGMNCVIVFSISKEQKFIFWNLIIVGTRFYETHYEYHSIRDPVYVCVHACIHFKVC